MARSGAAMMAPRRAMRMPPPMRVGPSEASSENNVTNPLTRTITPSTKYTMNTV
jgi:hypothetical protein